MRYRVKDYTVDIYQGNARVALNVPNTLIEAYPSITDAEIRKITEAIRLIVDETAGVVFCSSMQKNNIVSISAQNDQVSQTEILITFAIPDGKTVSASDQFTIEMDWGDTIKDNIPTDYAKPSHITAGVNEIKNFLGVAGSDGEGEFQALSMQEIFNMCDDIDTAILGENHPGLVTAEDHAAIIAAINIDGDIEWNDYVNLLTE